MSQRASLSFRSPLVLFLSFAGLVLPGTAVADARVSESYGKLPLHFEANHGQADKEVRFLSRGSGYSLYLTAGEAVLVLTRPDPDGKQNGHSTPERRAAPAQAMPAVLRMSIVGAAPAPLVSGREELPGKANYFVGKDPAKWRTNVPTYAKVHYREIYPGIDLVYYGNQRQLEYDFVVAPGADPKKIVLGFKGAERMEIDAGGDLVLHAPGGAIRQKKPVIYQEIDGVRQEVAGSYVRKGAKRVGFQVAAYDTGRPLIIDPVVLSYSTFLGGRDIDQGWGIAVDSAGNAYVTGTTGTNFPTTPGAFQPAAAVSSAFVTKLNPAGSALVYSTYLGGSVTEWSGGIASTGSNGIAVDADGRAYVTGSTNTTDFPTTTGAFQRSIGGFGDGFVTKLSPDGSTLAYSTYLGGGDGEAGFGIAVDAAGNAYVTGWASTGYPTTPGAFQRSYAGGGADAVVTKLNPAGSALVYSTYLGGSSSEFGTGIAVDVAGNAYVTGSTLGGFPTTPGALQPTYGGGNDGDAFVAKLDPAGSILIYSTYLGGSGSDGGSSIAVDASGDAYVTGDTSSVNFPTTAGAFQPTFGGGFGNAFVTKLNSTGSALVYSTYLGGGGGGGDQGSGIAVDASGNAYVTGVTHSVNFPVTPGSLQLTCGRVSSEAFVTKLTASGSELVYSTLLGDNGIDLGRAIAVDAAGNAYVTGLTTSRKFPTTPGAFQSTIGDTNGAGDAFVTKITEVDLVPVMPSSTRRCEESDSSYTGIWNRYGSETGTFSSGSILSSTIANATATFVFSGTAVTWIGVRCDICGIAIVSIDGGVPTVVNTHGPGSGHLTSEPVFSASGLAPGVAHTLVITVTGATTSADAHVAVDAFDVTTGGGAAPPPPLPLGL